jgi:nitroreductase
MTDIGLFEAINTQRGITHYKPDPVPIEAIETILDAATKAPNGSNLQPWEFVVIIEPELVKQVGEFYREAWLDRMGRTPEPDESAVHKVARALAYHMPEVPAMILVCVDHVRGYGTYKEGRPDRPQPPGRVDLAVRSESVPCGARTWSRDPPHRGPRVPRGPTQRDPANPEPHRDGVLDAIGLSG